MPHAQRAETSETSETAETSQAPADWHSWQRTWDLQQEAFMPDREERFAALLDVVEAARGRHPRVLDLACGTGSLTRRLLAPFPDATSLALDLDPALLRIARGTFAGDDRVRVVRADLSSPEWRNAVGGDFDAVLTATALHWLPEHRLRSLYAEVADVLRAGGVFCNADHMVDPGLPGLTERLTEFDDARREKSYAAGAALSWPAWWDAAREAPELADAVAERDALFSRPDTDHTESLLGHPTHLDFLRTAGFSEVGLVWRGRTDAAFAAVK
ncbi:class I SAM-dependent methyltransferase [Actinopolymorpha sp. B11F2]|uniref:class I SAM-dependent methyltransferase n=1 Tax=Actinopolymorpha sp. B11F2 TaxID=3160862 RepID=UPI0032E3E5E8